jgi:PAS domain S-box-containing protein
MSDEPTMWASFLDGVDHTVFVLDPRQNRIVYANRAACEMLGYEREELVATPISVVHPAELAQLEAWVDQVRRDQIGWSALFNCRTKSGARLPVEMTALVPDPDGLVILFARDRSQHRGPAR